MKIFTDSVVDYPAGHKPFKSPLAFAELDLPHSDALMSDYEYKITIPAQTTRREAMRLVHRSSARFMSMTFLEAQAEHTSALETLTDAGVLRTLVDEVLAEAAKPHLAEEFGLTTRALTSAIGEETIQARVASLYRKIYEQLNQKLSTDAEATRKSREEMAQRDATISTRQPDQLLEDLVSRKVDVKLLDAGLVAPTPDIADNADASNSQVNSTAAQFVDAMRQPGNGSSPPVEVGQNRIIVKPTPKRHARTSQQTWGKEGARPRQTAWTDAQWAHWLRRPSQGKGRGAHARQRGSSHSGKGGGTQGWRRGARQE